MRENPLLPITIGHQTSLRLCATRSKSSAMTDSNRAESSDMESVEDDDEMLVSRIMNQPGLLAALQSRFNAGAVMENLPAPVKRKVKALKQLQLLSVNLEAKFYEEVHALEYKYHKLSANLYEKRSNIVSGVYEPTDEECVWDSDEEEEEITNDLKEKVKIEEINEENTNDSKKDEDKNEKIKGIPDFWLTIFKNVGMLTEMVQEHDEPILKHLYNIQVIFLEADPMGFILEFHFEPNEYFSNAVLTKEYLMKCVPEKNDPFSFEGPEIYKTTGCTIEWKKGKNVTVKTIKKNQKHKSRGHMRTVTKTVQNDSFFNFFSPPIVPDDSEAELDDDTQALLTSDFEIGHYIKERIVPRAVLYYTGEGLEDEGDEYEEDDGDDDDDSEDDEIDDEEHEGQESGVARDGTGAIVKEIKPQECKQQ